MAAVRMALQPVLGNELPFLTLFPPVFFAAWLGGLGPALVGQLAGGMAHEANNQMSVVLGAASFILARGDIPEPVRQDVEYIHQAAERTAAITRQLLAFSRRQILQRRVVDLNAVLEHLEPILRRTLTEQQKLVLHLSEDVIPIRADRAQLDQVLLNLTINARAAMADGGTVTLETRNARLTEEYVAQREGVTIVPGTYAALLISDTGHGMDKQTMKRLLSLSSPPGRWGKEVTSDSPWSMAS